MADRVYSYQGKQFRLKGDKDFYVYYKDQRGNEKRIRINDVKDEKAASNAAFDYHDVDIILRIEPAN